MFGDSSLTIDRHECSLRGHMFKCSSCVFILKHLCFLSIDLLGAACCFLVKCELPLSSLIFFSLSAKFLWLMIFPMTFTRTVVG